ncbi:RNA-directed DNA polymerase, eukaryota, reverse transcriptase zinc-binding domain protein [Tanacetum coccineum]
MYNILLTQELLRGYDWKNWAKRVATKIDIQKAYDTVSWDFLEDALKMFEFPTQMIQWIMVYVRTFSINVNGERHGYFKEGRGYDKLIASVLSSMQMYWAIVFILPKLIVKDIHKLFKGFLWCQGDLSRVQWLMTMPEIHSIQVPALNENQKDYTMWKDRNGSLTKFSLQKAWKVLRKNEEEVLWFKVD